MAKIKEQKLIEICRSFSFHLNIGNFQGCDFFCSEKEETPEDKINETSERLAKFCYNEVAKSIQSYMEKKREKVIQVGEEWNEEFQKDYNKTSQIQEDKLNQNI